jgi:hypothetical protein
VYIGTQPAIGQNRKLDSIAASFNGILTTFNLTVNTASIVPSNVYQLFISLGGVLQNPGVDFTANGNQITFTTAPAAGLSFFGIFQGDSITGTPTIADASITTLKLATGLTVTHTAGTAAAPSVTFASDLANGVFAPAANTFGITTGGTERLRVDSNGFAAHTGAIGRGAPVTKTSAFTVGIAENWLICNGAASITVTLPTASAWTGREIMLKTIAAFTVVSASSNVVPLAGGAAGTGILAATAGKYATLVSDGTNWIIMQAS